MRSSVALAAALVASLPAFAADLWPQLEPVYTDLHAHPELSGQEIETAEKLAGKLKALGFDVTSGVAKTGVVGVLKNGAGPTVMLRTEMDALPVEEKTGLPYASKVRAKNTAGDTVSVMHACGHDVHMTAWLGAATVLAGDRASWHGTLVMVGQPAEEIGTGAHDMLADGLFTRFPKPDAALAVHDSEMLAAGTIGIRPGPVFASADSVDIVVHGRGGHGGKPQVTVDPIVIGSRMVLAFQTLVSRETNPFDPAVVTVGAFRAGTRPNIIPDTAELLLTVRAYSDEVRASLLAGIRRIAKAEAEAANAPEAPSISTAGVAEVTINDPALAARIESSLKKALGDARVVEQIRVMAGEDFCEYARAGVPSVTMQLGATAPDVLAKSKSEGTVVPSIHSSLFAPDAKPAVTTGIDALVAAAKTVFAR
ncbi:MAG TPA: amidohydrolase [Candidatus Polarisedimenticolaceae bacterium]|nr:amidohydrolase [Candidatus Polarisedimenticolaceae bacterium]